jgi:MFS superfamily sulfate permease-like transporter
MALLFSMVFDSQNISKINFKNEILAGLTVSMTMIPESLSFAILAGLTPLMGLYAAFLMGIVTAILGGRPGLVSGGSNNSCPDGFDCIAWRRIFASYRYIGRVDSNSCRSLQAR